MKILFSPCHYIYDQSSGGSEYSWAFNIADSLASKNPGSAVVTGFKNFSEPKDYPIVEVQQDKKKLDMSFKNALIFNLKYFRETERQFRKKRFDLVHHVLPFAIDYTFNLSFLLGRRQTPLVIGPIQPPMPVADNDRDASDMSGFSQKRNNNKSFLFDFALSVFRPLLRFLSLQTLKHADRLIVINDYTKDILVSRGISAEKINTITPGIDTRQFVYTPLSQKRAEKIELLTVCYLVERKAVDLLILALAEIIKEDQNVILKIVGDGPQLGALKKLVTESGLDNYVSFEGFVPNSQVQDYYRRAHIFLSMSRYETWGQVYLEALASGLPVISAKNPGCELIITENKNGYLVEPGDYQSLARQAINLSKNKPLLEEFGRRARESVEQNYDWQRVIIPKYSEALSAVLNKRTNNIG